MSIRFTEEEMIGLGYWKDKRGEWHGPKNQCRAGYSNAPIPGSTDIQRNDSRKMPQLESSPDELPKKRNGAQRKNASRGSGRYRIEVEARCRRHTDPDNLCPKWFIDRLRECGIIPDDSSEFVVEVVKRVVKIESWEPETTTIEVWEI